MIMIIKTLSVNSNLTVSRDHHELVGNSCKPYVGLTGLHEVVTVFLNFSAIYPRNAMQITCTAEK